MLSAMGTGHRTETVERARRALLEQLRRARGDEPLEPVARRAVGRSRQWLSKVEAGVIDVSLADFVALCSALDLSVQLLPDAERARRQIRELGRRAASGPVPADFGVRVLRAIARELERGDQSVKKDIGTP